MATFFRLVQAQWADSAMNGAGARLAGGRWNSPGLPAVYLAGSRALAALEVAAHAPREVLALEWRIIAVEVPDGLIESVEKRRLPDDWRNLPSSPGARRFGDAWLRSHVALALKLPSVVIPEEPVLLLNPLHRQITRIKVSKPAVFHFDSRL
jgi:RES domain-containing protein